MTSEPICIGGLNVRMQMLLNNSSIQLPQNLCITSSTETKMILAVADEKPKDNEGLQISTMMMEQNKTDEVHIRNGEREMYKPLR